MTGRPAHHVIVDPDGPTGRWSLWVSTAERAYVRDRLGGWLYANAEVAVPGARDVLLADKHVPQFISGDGGLPESAIMPAHLVHAHPELRWMATVGSMLVGRRPGEHAFLIIPIAEWERRRDDVVDLDAPELSSDPLIRDAAVAEREFRFAQHAAAHAARVRAQVFARLSSSLSRRRLAEVTGLSPARIQQIIGEAQQESLDLEGMPLRVLEVLRDVGPMHVEALAGVIGRGKPVRYGRLDKAIRELEWRQLAVRGLNGWRVTEVGAAVAEKARAGAVEA